MGVKSFFKNLGRKISSGFKNLVSGAGAAIGGAATWLQRKAIPAIAGGATKAADLLGKATPAIEGINPEAGAAAGEAGQVLSKVGDITGKFAKFIGSDIADRPVKVMNAEQQAAFAQSPLGLAFKRSQTKPPAPITPPAPAPAFVMPPMPKGLISAAPFAKPLIGSNPASYSPVKMSSGIEAPPPANQPKIAVMSAGTGGITPMLG